MIYRFFLRRFVSVRTNKRIPAVQNTLLKRMEVRNSEKGEDGLKRVPIDISFTAVGIIFIPTEKERITA